MSSGRTSKRAKLAARIEGVQRIDESIWEELKRDLAPISDSYLRSLLRESGCQLPPLIEGVRTTDLAEAERTLCALAAEYEPASEESRKSCRSLVLDAKQRLRWRLKRTGEPVGSVGTILEEMLLWTSTWLENPVLFPEWVSLRRKLLSREDRTPPP